MDPLEIRNQLEEAYASLREMPDGPRKAEIYAQYRRARDAAGPLLEAAGLPSFGDQEALDLVSRDLRERLNGGKL